jgi:hypothetical protein
MPGSAEPATAFIWGDICELRDSLSVKLNRAFAVIDQGSHQNLDQVCGLLRDGGQIETQVFK